MPSVSTMAVSAYQGPFIFLSYVVLSKEVRKALKFACSRKPSPDPALTTKSTLTSVRGPGSELKSPLGRRGSRPQEPVCSLYFLTWASFFPISPSGGGGEVEGCSLGRKCCHWVKAFDLGEMQAEIGCQVGHHVLENSS